MSTDSPLPDPSAVARASSHPWSASNAAAPAADRSGAEQPFAPFGPCGKEAVPPLVSEEDCLALIHEYFPNQSSHLPFGRGSDCAELLRLPHCLALSTDLFLEHHHFKTEWITPAEAGAKALSAAVSDLAAAGAVPKGFSLGLMLPPDFSREAFRQILAAMEEKAAEYKMILSGGDISANQTLGFSVTVWGDPAGPEAEFLRRGKPMPGDRIFLIGEAGLARVGLWALQRQGRSALADWPAAGAAFLNPKPLLAEGQALALLALGQGGGRRRMGLMDVSDGLMRDLPRLLGGLGADLTFAAGLIHPEVLAASRSLGRLPEDLFLSGGEDYALLGICEEALWPEVWAALPDAALLGEVTRGPGLTRFGQQLTRGAGFDHFAAEAPSRMQEGPEDTAQGTRPASSVQAVRDCPPMERISTPALEDREEDGVKKMSDPIRQAAREMARVCRLAWQFGLLAGFNGNASCRIREYRNAGGEKEEVCLVTRSGAAKNLLTEDDFALLSLKTGALLAGSAPSSEASMHLAVYRKCPESAAVLHTHPPYLLGLSVALPPENRLNLPLPEAEAYRARLAFTPALPPGSRELADTVARAAAGHAAVWMEHHGLMAHAPTMAGALALAEELEQLARVQLFSMFQSTIGSVRRLTPLTAG